MNQSELSIVVDCQLFDSTMLRWTCLRLECHRGRIDCPLVWDLSHNVTFAAWKEKTYEEKLPCVLRGHRYYHCGRQSSLVASCKLQPNIVTYYMWNMAVRGVSLCECVSVSIIWLCSPLFFFTLFAEWTLSTFTVTDIRIDSWPRALTGTRFSRGDHYSWLHEGMWRS